MGGLGWALALATVVGCGNTPAAPTATAPPAGGAPAAADGSPTAGTVQDDLHPVVLIRTTLGDLHVRLDAERAPRTVQNFLNYVYSGHYDGTIFHQVERDYVALGGSYTPDLTEKQARYPIPNEATNGLRNRRGTIAMARRLDTVDSSTCQFFINLADNPKLDHRGDAPDQFGFCVFGEVIEGLDVLDRLSAQPVKQAEGFSHLPVETVWLKLVRRIR